MKVWIPEYGHEILVLNMITEDDPKWDDYCESEAVRIPRRLVERYRRHEQGLADAQDAIKSLLAQQEGVHRMTAEQQSLDDAPTPRRVVDVNAAPVGRHHPQTSKDAAARALPRTGSKRAAVMRLVADRDSTQPGSGVTDDEIERAFGWTHQSASACRNGLMNDGWLEDSGERRAVEHSGNMAIVWRLTEQTRNAR